MGSAGRWDRLGREGGWQVLGRRWGAREVLGRGGERWVGWVVGSGCRERRCWVLWTTLLVAAADGGTIEGEREEARLSRVLCAV